MRVLLLIFLCMWVGDDQSARPVRLFMIGDSTMANWSDRYYPETGWGQVLPTFFNDNIRIINCARSGKSSKSFRGQGFWQPVLDSILRGDFVIIQFGHNDSKPDTAYFTDPETTYRDNLRRYVMEVRKKGANPILCTSIVRRRFNSEGTFFDTMGNYPEVTRQVAAAMEVPLLDLHQRTIDLVNTMGPEASKDLFLHLKPGQYPNWPDGKEDNTHLSPDGAKRIAALAAEEIRRRKISLEKYLK